MNATNESFAAVISSILPTISQLGFAPIRITAYTAEFSNRNQLLCMEAVPHQPEINMCIRFSNGAAFELCLLSRLLAPDWYEAYRSRSAAHQSMLQSAVEMLDFVHENRETIFRRIHTIEMPYQALAEELAATNQTWHG